MTSLCSALLSLDYCVCNVLAWTNFSVWVNTWQDMDSLEDMQERENLMMRRLQAMFCVGCLKKQGLTNMKREKEGREET